MRPRATASRAVTALAETSTMRAAPAASTWLSVRFSADAVPLEEVAEEERGRALPRRRLRARRRPGRRARWRRRGPPRPPSPRWARARPPAGRLPTRTRAGRWFWRPERLLIGVQRARPRPAGRDTTRAPCMRSSAARTKTSNVTWAETGLPGRPNTSLSPRRPKTSGAPGLIATFVKSSPTSKRASTSSTRSKAPSDTPPEMTSTSDAKPCAHGLRDAVRLVGHHAQRPRRPPPPTRACATTA